jgi:hypothetical protein
MVLGIGLLTALLFGFVLGRIWQIRQQIIWVEGVDKRRSPYTVKSDRTSGRSQLIDSEASASRSNTNNGLAVAPEPIVRLRGGPAPFTGRFQGLHQSLHHAGASSLY